VLFVHGFWAGNTKWIAWGGIPSWLVIWGLINDAKLFQNLSFCLLIDHFKVVIFFDVTVLNAHPK
jgi:hypothetical protein